MRDALVGPRPPRFDVGSNVTNLAQIVGQPSAVAVLRRMLSTGRVPHALIFHGPQGIGKATTARAFAAALLCEAGASDACGAGFIRMCSVVSVDLQLRWWPRSASFNSLRRPRVTYVN